MDVNYGDEVKRYLTDRVSLLRIHRFCPSDVQFDDALVSSAVVVFEKRRPQPGHEAVLSFGGTLTEPASAETVTSDRLRAARSGPRCCDAAATAIKAPAVSLGDLFVVKRGLATGNNDFFIVPRAALRELGVPPSFVRPILPSPRFLKTEIIDGDLDGWPVLDRQLALIDCGLSEDDVGRKWPLFAQYLEEGRRRGINLGYLASRRSPWYSQEKREPAPFACTYMGRFWRDPSGSSGTVPRRRRPTSTSCYTPGS